MLGLRVTRPCRSSAPRPPGRADDPPLPLHPAELRYRESRLSIYHKMSLAGISDFRMDAAAQLLAAEVEPDPKVAESGTGMPTSDFLLCTTAPATSDRPGR